MLSRRWIINVSLVVLIAVLTFIGLGLDDDSAIEEKPGISHLKPADINRVSIGAGKIQLDLRRDQHGWNIESPIAWPAYDSNVNRLLNILDSDADAIGQVADADLKSLGLEPPAASLRVNDTQLLFGATNNIGERRYVQVNAALYLLPDVHLAFLTQGLPGMVDRRLLPGPDSTVRLKLPDFEIVQHGNDGWQTKQKTEFTPAQLRQLVGNWQGLQATRVTDFDNSSSIRQAIEAELADGRIVDFLLLSSTPEIVIANPEIGLQYHFRADYHDQLLGIGESAGG